MEVKRIEARIGDWSRVVHSIVTKDALSCFLPRIFLNHFSKAVFIIILKGSWIFIYTRITIKKVS